MKKDYTPIYLQISEDIKKQILSGKYIDGDKIPSESELIETYKVTRTTIQKGLNILVNEGLIEKIHGKGSYVRLKSIKKNIWNFSSFSTYAKKTNQIPITKVIEHKIFIDNNITYLKLLRLRGFKKLEENEWITLDSSVLNLDKFNNLDKYDFSISSLYETLEKDYKIIPSYAELNIKPIIPDNIIANLLEIKQEIPLLNAKGNVYDKNGEIIEKVSVIYGDSTNFNIVVNV